MLNSNQKKAIKIFNKIYSFLCDLPLVWDDEFSSILVNRKRSSLVCYLLNLFNLLVLALACVYDLLSSFILQRPDYGIGIASLHLICLMILLIIFGGILCITRNMECITAANLGIQLNFMEKPEGKQFISCTMIMIY